MVVIFVRIVNVKVYRRGFFAVIFLFLNLIFVGFFMFFVFFGDVVIFYILFYYMVNIIIWWMLGVYGIIRDNREEN